MDGEDLSFMPHAKPGSDVRPGAGKTENDPQGRHPLYEVNDDILPAGASCWATLAAHLPPRVAS